MRNSYHEDHPETPLFEFMFEFDLSFSAHMTDLGRRVAGPRVILTSLYASAKIADRLLSFFVPR